MSFWSRAELRPCSVASESSWCRRFSDAERPPPPSPPLLVAAAAAAYGKGKGKGKG